ncbi:hypothetical protein SUGI_0985240 [Cryptomeria japonica]|uniref:phosphatidylinositol 4-kinase gamma 5 n=1 Tax=Cryptomeria japonica TaxID=3369 RepID=UPI002414C356|nr:phosphatidylinositol 4-kinase gamma 5 [Cryptomeria japonica]GLJ46726.1 hypothetical protein SUGI_0985240 [Cryptomeria japonica]
MIVKKSFCLPSRQGTILVESCCGSQVQVQGKLILPNMPSQIDCPIQTRMAVAVGEEVANKKYHGLQDATGKATSRRRVFVQTDTGSVLGIELDRADNAHTVKKKLQLALNVPTEETALTFGDLVLKNDLSVVRNDAPLRLTRGDIHRSSSTPCLSPRIDNLQYRDRSGPLEIVGGSSGHSEIKKLIKQAVRAVESGVDPIPVQRGLGGAYYFRDILGKSIAIVKPTDEEPFAPNNPKGFVGKILGQPGLKRSIRVGETGVREVAAYLLDHDGFAKVPPTVLVKISHSVFHLNNGMTASKIVNGKQSISKIASFQQYVEHDFDANDHGTSSFSVAAVHRIGILDIRVLNTDRHAGNILVKTYDTDFLKYSQMGGAVELIPIDHGLCLPETLEDPYFEWLHWPQASIPFSEAELEYISRLDALKEADMLRTELPMMRESSLRILILCTIFLKTAAAAGLCLAEIGGIMGREIYDVEEEASELEVVCLQAKIETDQQISAANSELVEDLSEGFYEEEHSADQSQIDFHRKENLMYQLQFDLEDGNDFQNGTVLTNNKNDDVCLNFGERHDTQGSGKKKLNMPQGTGLSLLLPQSSFPSPQKNGLQFHSALNSFCAIHALSPRISNEVPGLPLPLNFSSPKPHKGWPLAKLEEVPIEEEETQELFPEDKLENSIMKKQSPVSNRQFIMPKSKTFFQRNQRCTTYIGARKGFARKDVSPSKTMQSEPEPGMMIPNTIKFSDMSKEEWTLFIDNFQKLLPGAIASRKQGTVNHKQRLGASCQF